MLRARELRAGQRMIEAEAAIAEARRLAPADPLIAFLHAQARYELGFPAADLFATALKLDPANRDCLRNQALALVSEQRGPEARVLLEVELMRQPGWLDGHKALATLNWTDGQQTGFADHYGDAIKAEPRNEALWLVWFGALAQARDWDAARAVLGQAEAALGQVPALIAAQLFVAVEGGDDKAAERLLAATAHYWGDTISLCRVRHALRQAAPERAEAEIMPLLGGPSAALFWPYASLCWRLRGDPRWEWLDRPDALIATRDSVIDAAELVELAELLRGLHTAAAPYVEQSVRGGTQTDRSVLLRHEPLLQRTRASLLDAIRGYVDGLPPPDPQHPLLSAPRGELLVAGSWSVRLLRQGFNVPHTHALGWLSTAFYVSLPDDLGAEPAGHIEFGRPPAELGLALETYRTIRPEPGRLAIFPSTMWHATVPFAAGERLVIAFDVARPCHPR